MFVLPESLLLSRDDVPVEYQRLRLGLELEGGHWGWQWQKLLVLLHSSADICHSPWPFPRHKAAPNKVTFPRTPCGWWGLPLWILRHLTPQVILELKRNHVKYNPPKGDLVRSDTPKVS